jgi:hypothetical protein
MEPVAEVRIGEVMNEADAVTVLRQLEQKINEIIRVLNDLTSS